MWCFRRTAVKSQRSDGSMALTRPSTPRELATDEVPLTPFVQYAYEVVEGNFNYLLCLQSTAPLAKLQSIDRALESGRDDGADSIDVDFLLTPFDSTPSTNWTISFPRTGWPLSTV